MDARLLAREHGVSAVRKLISIMNNRRAAHSAQIVAAVNLLDRGYGRPPQAVEVFGGDVRPEEREGSALEFIVTQLNAMRERHLAEGHPLLIQP